MITPNEAKRVYEERLANEVNFIKEKITQWLKENYNPTLPRFEICCDSVCSDRSVSGNAAKEVVDHLVKMGWDVELRYYGGSVFSFLFRK